MEVAQQETSGAMGEAKANREKEISVAEQIAQSEEGRKKAEAEKRIKVAELETTAAIGEAKSNRDREVNLAEALKDQDIKLAVQKSEAEQGKKEAEADQRIRMATLEADAVEGENQSKTRVAEFNADLTARTAEADRKSEVAKAKAEQEILEAQRLSEKARLEKSEIVTREIEKRKKELDAEASAEEIRRIAKGESDAKLMQFEAEAEGLRKVLEAKSEGYKEIIDACGGDSKAAATLLLLEKLEDLVGKQTDAIANMKIDKITVWDNGGSEGGSTGNFIKNFIGALPPIHELAQQAGIELPKYLGNIDPATNIPENTSQKNSDTEEESV